MTVMYSFCFWYSVRLGTIIVAFTCMAQCIAALVACGYGIRNLERTSSNIEYWLETNHLKMTKILFQTMKDDPKSFLVALITVLSIYFCSCISLIYAAFQVVSCNVIFMYPFMILDFVRLLVLSFALVVVLVLIKENTLNLGIIIGASISGVFTLLYLWYQWFCTVSLWQIIKEIERLDHVLANNKPAPKPVQDLNELNAFYNTQFYMPDVSL